MTDSTEDHARQPEAGAGESAGSPFAPGTLNRPMTAAVRAALLGVQSARLSSSWLIDRVMLVAGIAFVPILIAFLSSRSEGRDLALVWLAVLAALLGLLAYHRQLAHKLARAVGEDVAEGVFLRTTGHAVLLRNNIKAAVLYSIQMTSSMQPDSANGDSEFRWDSLDPLCLTPIWQDVVRHKGFLSSVGIESTRSHHQYELVPSPVTADHTKQTNLLLEVRDADGGLIYRCPEYHPD